jgi:spore maturation protein CgeB
VDDKKVSRTIGSRGADFWLRARVRAFRPDHMIVGKSLGVSPEALHAVCDVVTTTMWYRDLTIPPDPRIIERARHVDTTFLTVGGQTEDFEAAGVRHALFLPDGVDPEIDRPMPADPEFECDVAFLGSGGDEYRTSFLARIAKSFRLRTWGRDWDERSGKAVNWTGRPAFSSDVGRVCASAAVVIGIERGVQRAAMIRNSSSNRMWRVLCAGGFYLGFAAPGLRDLARDGEHCAFYDDEDHAMELLGKYIEDRAARARIRAGGRQFVLAHHTIDHRIKNLLTGQPFRNPLDPAPVA